MLMELETKKINNHAEQLIAQYLEKLLVEATPDKTHTLKFPESKNGRSKVETEAR